jgi:hypothetical protein
MPDTKILRKDSGWIDTDVPNVIHRVRREARDARRANRVVNKAITNVNISSWKPTGHATVTGVSVTHLNSTLTGLQQKLYDRLTNKQGVDTDDALDVILNNGYNKAASYGHMREAGATDAEARIVISLNEPQVSLDYGLHRGMGYDHIDALKEALSAD